VPSADAPRRTSRAASATSRRAALDKVLAEHSSPSRKLRWNEKEQVIDFDVYDLNKIPDPIPFHPDAGR